MRPSGKTATAPGPLARLVAQYARLDDDRIALAAMAATSRHDVPAAAQRQPLALLCRSLRDEAGLHRAGVTAAVARLVDLVGAWQTVPPPREPSGTRPLVITGLPDAPMEALAQSLVRAGATGAPSPDPLEVALSSWSFEMDWHLPTYAEWLHDADLTEAYRTGAGAAMLVGTAHLERMAEIGAALPGATVVVIETGADRFAERSADLIAPRRAQWSHRVDAAALRRYLDFRLGVMLERARSEPTGARVVRVPEAAVRSDPDGVAATVIDGGR